MSTTTIRLPDELRARVESVATASGSTAHAFMLEAIADATERAKELETKVGASFEKEEHYQHLCRRQSEIEEKLDLTKNQAPSQVEASDAPEVSDQKTSEKQTQTHSPRPKRRATISV